MPRAMVTIELAEYKSLVEGKARSTFLEGEAVYDKLDTRLLAKPSKFSGLSKDANAVHDFLHSMLAYLTLARIAPAFWVPMASTFLEGEAGTYFRSITAVSPASTMSWACFAEGLRATFGNINQSAIARSRIHEFRQTGRVETYYKRFVQLCAEITDNPLSEAERVFLFRQGLNSALQLQVAMEPITHKPYTSFQELTTAALAFGTVQRAWTVCAKSMLRPLLLLPLPTASDPLLPQRQTMLSAQSFLGIHLM